MREQEKPYDARCWQGSRRGRGSDTEVQEEAADDAKDVAVALTLDSVAARLDDMARTTNDRFGAVESTLAQVSDTLAETTRATLGRGYGRCGAVAENRGENSRRGRDDGGGCDSANRGAADALANASPLPETTDSDALLDVENAPKRGHTLFRKVFDDDRIRGAPHGNPAAGSRHGSVPEGEASKRRGRPRKVLAEVK